MSVVGSCIDWGLSRREMQILMLRFGKKMQNGGLFGAYFDRKDRVTSHTHSRSLSI